MFGNDIVPEICLFHGDCLDGFGAAYAVWKRYPNCEFVEAFYNRKMPTFGNKHVIMVDFSYSEKVTRHLITVTKSLTIIDHHHTAFTRLHKLLNEGLIYGDFTQDKCSAVLTWELFHPDKEVPELLLHIQDYYLWKSELPGSKEICTNLSSYSNDFNIWNTVIDNFAEKKDTFIIQGDAIDRQRQKEISELLNTCVRTMVIGGIAVPVANLPRTMSSDAATTLAHSAPFGATYMDTPDHRVFSLRSIASGVNVAEIAIQYGDGGGREHAAGFHMPLDWQGDVPIPQVPTIGYILTKLNSSKSPNAINPLIEYWKRLWAQKHRLKYTFIKDINYLSPKEAAKFATEYCPPTHHVSYEVAVFEDNPLRSFSVGFVDFTPTTSDAPVWEIHERTQHITNQAEFYIEHSICILKATFMAILRTHLEEE